MEKLKISYSGIRGIYREGLDEEVARCFGEAFARFCLRLSNSPVILLGMDTRPSGESLKEGLKGGLLTCDCILGDLGVVPSPTLSIYLAKANGDGGIMVTASHNPLAWNGFKFYSGSESIILDDVNTRELIRIYRDVKKHPSEPPSGPAQTMVNLNEAALRLHLNRILSSCDVELLKGEKLRVAIDSGRGAGTVISIRLLEALGCDIVPVDIERESEPTPANLTGLCREVIGKGCDVGFAQDLDADRLALVSEKGEAVGEEYTLALAARHLLDKYRSARPVVVRNSSTTHLLDHLVETMGGEILEVKVGEVNLSRAFIELMNERRLAFGGEGNGGVIFPPVGYTRDSLSGMALILEAMAARKKRLSELVLEMPRFTMLKEKLVMPERRAAEAFLKKCLKLFQEQEHRKIIRWDGIKSIYPDGSWCQVRRSNTEPVVRVIAESPDPSRARKLLDAVLAL
jgi:phosphomannomutase